MKTHIVLPILLALLLCAGGCVREQTRPEGENVKNGYTQITQEEAKERMARKDGHLVVDVRRQDEFDGGHIPGAICLPNETIGETCPPQLPDRDQILLIYCRSGNRSKQAAQKLADLGYTNVFEFGGILTWTGEIVTEEEPAEVPGEDPSEEPAATLSFESFDGGGLEYTVRIGDESILTCESVRNYHRPDHNELTGAGFDVVFTFYGAKPGVTTVTVTGRSPIIPDFDAVYEATVDADLRVTLTEMEAPSEKEEEGVPVLAIDAGGETFYASFEDNPSALALIEKLREGELTADLHDYGNFEKVGDLPWELPRSDTRITTVPGDVILYLGRQITVYYDQNTWDFTRLAHIDGADRETLLAAFGPGNVTVTFRLEWE